MTHGVPDRRTIAAVLGCSPSAVSMLRSGSYDRPNSDLPARWRALEALLAEARAGSVAEVLRRVCLECPRESCAGCRIAEIT